MAEQVTENLIRYAWLREEVKPITYGGESSGAISGWIGISHATCKTLERSDALEFLHRKVYSENGEPLDSLQFETLDIALDPKAHAIAGVEPNEWTHGNLSSSDDGPFFGWLWQSKRGPTNRWTRAAGACFAT